MQSAQRNRLLGGLIVGIVLTGCAPTSPAPAENPNPPPARPVDRALAALDRELATLQGQEACDAIAAALDRRTPQELSTLSYFRQSSIPREEQEELQIRLQARRVECESALAPVLKRCEGNAKLRAALEVGWLGLYVPQKSKAVPPTPVALVAASGSASVPMVETAGPNPIRTYEALQAALGQNVVVEGTVAKIPHSHMMESFVPRLVDSYLDLQGGSQVVVYAAQRLACASKVRVEGTVGQVSGAGPNGAVHKEIYLKAAKWSCAD